MLMQARHDFPCSFLIPVIVPAALCVLCCCPLQALGPPLNSLTTACHVSVAFSPLPAQCAISVAASCLMVSLAITQTTVLTPTSTTCSCFPPVCQQIPHTGPVGSYNPDPLNPASRMEEEDDSTASLANYADKPNFKQCSPCGTGFSTVHAQSTSRRDCLADCACGRWHVYTVVTCPISVDWIATHSCSTKPHLMALAHLNAPSGYGTVAPNYDECVLAPPGSWAPGGPVSSTDTRMRQCPPNKPVTISSGMCSAKHCEFVCY